MGPATASTNKLRVAAREKLIAEQRQQERRKRIRALAGRDKNAAV
jgi:hypothetical protein